MACERIECYYNWIGAFPVLGATGSRLAGSAIMVDAISWKTGGRLIPTARQTGSMPARGVVRWQTGRVAIRVLLARKPTRPRGALAIAQGHDEGRELSAHIRRIFCSSDRRCVARPRAAAISLRALTDPFGIITHIDPDAVGVSDPEIELLWPANPDLQHARHRPSDYGRVTRCEDRNDL